MERACRGVRRIRPSFSSCTIIWWTLGRGNAEEALEVGLCGRLTLEQDVGVDEGQVQALLLGEARGREVLDMRIPI